MKQDGATKRKDVEDLRVKNLHTIQKRAIAIKASANESIKWKELRKINEMKI